MRPQAAVTWPRAHPIARCARLASTARTASATARTHALLGIRLTGQQRQTAMLQRTALYALRDIAARYLLRTRPAARYARRDRSTPRPVTQWRVLCAGRACMLPQRGNRHVRVRAAQATRPTGLWPQTMIQRRIATTVRRDTTPLRVLLRAVRPRIVLQ